MDESLDIRKAQTSTDNGHAEINELNQKLRSSEFMNEQLKADIQTLLEFKNELENLAEDQNKQIQNLNNVSFSI